jgi:8-oxo-dGTP pyrophosphatase MutT (NUDIX family)
MDKTDIESSGEDFPNAIKKAALRELEEETGYKGDFICNTSKYFGKNNNLKEELKTGGNIFFDPWKSSDNAIQCIVEIDGDQVANKKEQKLDDTEFIKVYEIEIKDLMNFIYEKMNKEHYGCTSELYNFALGLNFNNIINDILNN